MREQERNRTNQEDKRGEVKRMRTRKIQFTTGEMEKGLNYFDLGEDGAFVGYYVIPAERAIVGLWIPTKEAKIKSGIQWQRLTIITKLYYKLTEEAERAERYLLEQKNPKASQFMNLEREYIRLENAGKINL